MTDTLCARMKAALRAFVFCAGILLSAVIISALSPDCAYAQTGTLGSEIPYVYCTYSRDGVAADGDHLSAGTYDVEVRLSDVENISVVQFTAEYDEAAVEVSSEPSSLVSDSSADIDSMGYLLGGGNIVFGFVSENSDCSALGGDTVLSSFTVTFSPGENADDFDAETYISFSPDPNYTFVQADYGDGYSSEYSVNPAGYQQVYSGDLFEMKADPSPAVSKNITGSIVVMTDYKGGTDNKPAYGSYSISLYSDPSRTEDTLVKTFTSDYSSADSENISNTFALTGVMPGTYYLTVSRQYAIARDDITLIVADSDIADVVIPIIACDFNEDGSINGADTRECTNGSKADSGYEYCDLNADGAISGSDARIVINCAVSDISYNEIIIK